MNRELPDVQAGFIKGRGTRDHRSNIHWIIEKAKEFQKTSTSASLTMAKPFDCVDHNYLWNVLKEIGIPDHIICLLRNLYAGQEATLRTDMEKQIDSKLGKEYVKAYLIYMKNTSYKMLHWMTHKLESRFLREITSDMHMIPL